MRDEAEQSKNLGVIPEGRPYSILTKKARILQSNCKIQGLRLISSNFVRLGRVGTATARHDNALSPFFSFWEFLSRFSCVKRYADVSIYGHGTW